MTFYKVSPPPPPHLRFSELKSRHINSKRGHIKSGFKAANFAFLIFMHPYFLCSVHLHIISRNQENKIVSFTGKL